MINLYRAEWRKVFANFRLTAFLVWIFPIGLFAFHTVMILGSLVSGTLQIGVEYFGSGDWTKDSLAAWDILIFFPANLFGRMLPLAFMAVVFAGEYQWRTLKNIVPRTHRWKLLLAKMAALITLVMISMLLTALIAALGPAIGHRLHGLPYGPALNAEVIGEFLLDTGRTALIALLSLLNLVSYGAIAAILTRSILGGLLIGFGFAVFDATSLGFLLFLRSLLGKPELINLYQFTPTYNLSNLHSWLFTGQAQSFISAGISPLTSEPSFWVSLLVLAIWIVGLIGLALAIFQRQELTE
ncbi:MAG: ABC transporter permease subunit [Anaerolineales bacterium]|nr:ABC transporter permease subunit [Anaerolineales bacterium]MCK5634146.1 ABC transporter permease subunit [Anaerolineales bacterium]